MTTIGNIEKFNNSTNWKVYKICLESWMAVNAIDEATKVKAFLSVIGTETVELLVNLCIPDEVTDKSYIELITLLDDHFNIGLNEVSEAYRFDTRKQLDNESISEFIVSLKKLSMNCNFGDKLNMMLRNRLITGVKSEQVKSRLLSIGSNLTWNEAVKIAQAMDAAGRASSSWNTESEDVKKVSTKYTKRGKPCYRCGKQNHVPTNCYYINTKCFACNETGHLKAMCKNFKEKSNPNVNREKKNRKVFNVQGDSHSGSDSDGTVLHLHTKTVKNKKPLTVDLCIDGQILSMEVDTGSCVTMIPFQLYKNKFSHLPLQDAKDTFVSFTGEEVKSTGKIFVDVYYNGKNQSLWLYVVECRYVLLGRDWLQYLKLDWNKIINYHCYDTCKVENFDSKLNQLLDFHLELFDEKLGTLSGIIAKLEINEGVQPKITKPYRVPFALKDKIEQELFRLEKLGIIKHITTSKWSTGIVVVPKPNGKVRICGNFKNTVNKILKYVAPPQINIDDIFAKVSGGKYFSKLDLAQAYNQMLVDDESQELLTISTHKGLYAYNRLAFGISTAPAIWQNAIEQVLNGLDGVQVYYDDILVTGETPEIHLNHLTKTLERLKKFGLKLNRRKCQFLLNEVEYLGYIINKNGIKPVSAKIDTILACKEPKDKTQLRSYLGLINYYRRFVPNFSELLAPLNKLLQKDTKFVFGKDENLAFENSKQQLLNSKILVHYDPNKPVVLTTDASKEGVGAVLAHLIDGHERPIQFASRSLTKAEKSYPQIEREALGIVFGLKKFYYYLYGRRFTLVTDNKPLVSIFGPNGSSKGCAAERMLRWEMYVNGFNFDIKYTKSNNNQADYFSRCPHEVANEENKNDKETFFVHNIQNLPVSSDQIAKETKKDVILSRVMMYARDGWPYKLMVDEKEAFQAYFQKRNEISIQYGSLLWGIRVIIPKTLKSQILIDLHEGHLGIVKMKAVARSYVWWPGLDKEIERISANCENCKSFQTAPNKAPFHPWLPAMQPWERIHVDYAGPYEGKMLLVVVDAFSKYPEVVILNSSTAEITIKTLHNLFAKFGIPKTLVTDNGTQFKCSEFETFKNRCGFIHKFTPPYHPSTNGQAERFVQSVKHGLNASKNEGTLQSRLDRFLLAYRTSPHAYTGETPAKLFLNRELRTRLDHLKPKSKFKDKIQNLLDNSDYTTLRKLEIGDEAWTRNYGVGNKWVRAIVIDVEGPKNYVLEFQGKLWRRSIDQIRKIKHKNQGEEESIENLISTRCSPPISQNEQVITESEIPVPEFENSDDINSDQSTIDDTDLSTIQTSTRPKRNVKRPKHLEEYMCT